MDKNIPWVEKYRPTNFDNIVLDEMNRKILKNIIDFKNFPNLLFYGPPGTGKTTTIINLVKEFQKSINQENKGLMIHLNASDERGVDIIRNQIASFVNTKGMFSDGIKFIILDEVDYMTKNAQYALKYLIQSYSKNVRYCLICNYISRIDESLQNEFIRLRFNQLPENDIIKFLYQIVREEKLNFTKTTLQSVRLYFNSDIRSMINYLQSNQNKNINIITDSLWESVIDKINNDNIVSTIEYMDSVSKHYNANKVNIVKLLFNYIIRNKQVNNETLSFFESIMHNNNIDDKYIFNYIIVKLKKLL